MYLTNQLDATDATRPACSYMSPEVFTHYDVSPALDIYSFGIVGEQVSWHLECRARAGAARDGSAACCNSPACLATPAARGLMPAAAAFAAAGGCCRRLP